MDIFKKQDAARRLLSSPSNLISDSETTLLIILTIIFALVGSSCAVNNSPLEIQVERSVVQVNATLQLNCTLTSYTASNATDITWSWNGAPITKANARVVAAGSAMSQLTLERVQFDDCGVYACRLADGTPLSTVTIQVGLLPAKATNLSCYSHNFVNFICSWTNGPDTNLPTSHQLMWEELHWGDSDKVSYHCNLTVCQMHDHHDQHDQHVEFLVNSSNALGDTMSEKFEFDTHRQVVLSPPRLTEVTAVNKSALLIEWQPPADYMDYPKSIEKYHFKYQIKCERRDLNSLWRTCSPGTKEVEVCNFPGRCHENRTHPSDILTGLSQPYGLYRISLRVKERSGIKWSAPSNILNQTTKEAAPMSGVSLRLTCEAINKTEDERDVQLRWQPLPDYKMNGAVRYYTINVSGLLLNVTRNSSSSYLARGLDPYEHQQISIVGYNSVGATDENICDVPPKLAVDRSTSVVAGIIVGTLLFIIFIILMVFTWRRVKKSMVHIPDIRLPNYIQGDNLHTYGGPHRGPVREKESYDELISSTLFVDLTPESDSCAPCCNGVMTNGFVQEKDLSKEPILEPLENRRKHPLLSARRTNSLVNENYSIAPTEQETLLSGDPFSEPDRSEEPSGDYPDHYGGWKDSALSIRSGGSYMHLREEDAASYSNMTDATLTPISEDGQRGVTDLPGDPQDTRPELRLPDGVVGKVEPELPQEEPECPYTFMGIGQGQGGLENLPQPPGSLENNGCRTSYTDMNGKVDQELRDQPCQNLPGSCRDSLSGKTKPPCNSHLCSVDDEFLEAAPDDACSSLGNYVQQGLFLSPSPNLPSSRSGSPRPNPSGRTTPKLLGPCSPQQPKGDLDSCGNPAQGLPSHPKISSPPKQTVEGPNSLDSPDSLQDDIQPYVLNTCVLSSSAEPLFVNPGPEKASSEPLCQGRPSQGGDCSSSVTLSNSDPSSENTPLMVNNGDVSECSSMSDEEIGANYVAMAGSEPDTPTSTANADGSYFAIGQLPPPATATATSAVNGNSRVDGCAVMPVDGGTYVAPGQLPSLTKAGCAADPTTQGTSCNDELDSEIGPGEVAKRVVPVEANTQCSGLNNVSCATNSDYVTEGNLQKMLTN